MKPTSDDELIARNRLFSLGRQVFVCALVNSPRIDRFSEWLLISAGASAGVLLSNITEISSHTSPNQLRWALIFVAGSALCGLTQKVVALLVSLQISISESVADIIFDYISKNESTLTPSAFTRLSSEIVDELARSAPCCLRERVRLRSKVGGKDPLRIYRDSLFRMLLQSLICGAQLLFLIVALVILAASFH